MAWLSLSGGWGIPQDGDPDTAFRMPLLADATTTLNGGTISQAADRTLTFVVPGGAALVDPGDMVIAVWRVKDIIGRSLTLATTEQLVGFLAGFLEDTAPALNSDSGLMLGLIDGSDPSTADGIGWRVNYTGGSRTVQSSRFNGGTTTDGAERVAVALDRFFGSSALVDDAYPWNVWTVAYNGDWEAKVKSAALTTAVQLIGDIHFFVAGLRTAATAGAATIKCRAAYSPPYVLDMDTLS